MLGSILKSRILIGAPNHNFVKGFVITDCKLPFSDITERLLSYCSQFSLFSCHFQFSSLKKMAFERKRFCFNLNCKVTEDEYKDESNFIKGTYEWYLSKGEKTKFNICSNCIIADFCSKTCQEQAQFLI